MANAIQGGKLLKETVKAWIDSMPGGPKKFIVVGELEVPTGGWHASAKAAIPQGVNPSINIVDVTSTGPTGIVTQVISRVAFRYEESPPKQDYKQATVRHDGDEVSVEVKRAQ